MFKDRYKNHPSIINALFAPHTRRHARYARITCTRVRASFSKQTRARGDLPCQDRRSSPALTGWTVPTVLRLTDAIKHWSNTVGAIFPVQLQHQKRGTTGLTSNNSGHGGPVQGRLRSTYLPGHI